MNHFRKLSLLLSLCCGVLWNSSGADAGIIIGVQSTSITAGGTGSVDVLISSDSNDLLDFAAYEFAITNVGGPVSTLEFTNATEVGGSPYVFAGDNLGINVSTLTNSQLIANDATNSGTGVILNSTFLLARLGLNHVLGPGQTAAQAGGEQFQISLLNSGNTLFQDNTLPVPTTFAFSSTSGLITVSSAAVPEPSTFAAIAMALGGFGLHRRPKKTNDGGCLKP